jgi:hypothetical protein
MIIALTILALLSFFYAFYSFFSSGYHYLDSMQLSVSALWYISKPFIFLLSAVFLLLLAIMIKLNPFW